MGVCTTEDQHHRAINRAHEEIKNCETESSKLYPQKKAQSFSYNNKNKLNNNITNNKSIDISLNSKKNIIKTIGQIKGESIYIKNNINCIILIMDYSYSVTIQNCQNCSIFIAPCETIIDVSDCQDLNLISASLNLNITKVKNGNFFSFVADSPLIQSSENIYLGNFFVQYMELPEMFVKSKLNIWNNKWSYYIEKGENSFIDYSTDITKQNVIDIFMPIFPTCYINIDQFQFVPFVYGKSLYIRDEFNNLLLILRQEDVPEIEILKMLVPEEIENYRVKLISTLTVKDKSDIMENLIKKLQNNNENERLINYLLRNNINNNVESLKNSQMKNISQNNISYNSVTKSRLNDYDLSNNDYFSSNNFKFLIKGDFLFLWFVNESDDFSDIFDYFNSYFEPLYVGKILKQQFNCDEIAFKQILKDIFEN